MVRVTLLTNLVPPYRSAAYNALHHCAVLAGGSLRVICTQQSEPQRNWATPDLAFDNVILPGGQIPLGENRTFAIPFGVKQALRREPTDVLILNGFGIAQWQAQNWALKHRIPSILQFDGWSGSDAAYTNPLRRRLRRVMVSRANVFIAASSRGAAWFERHGAARERVWITPIPPSFPMTDIITNSAVLRRRYGLLWCGRTTTAKGFDIFIEIATKLVERDTSLRIAIVGSTNIEKTKEIVKYRGLNNQIDVFDQLPPDQLPAILTNSKIALFPSRNDAYGVGAVDAIVCGAVALASPITGCAPDILQSSEILPIDDPQRWVSACECLLGDPGMLESTRQQQVTAIVKNTPDHHGNSIWQAICQAIDRKSDIRRWG